MPYCMLVPVVAGVDVVLSTGDQLHGYTVDKVQGVPEIDAVAIKLTHDGTGAQHLHIAKDDPNNTFRYITCTELYVECV